MPQTSTDSGILLSVIVPLYNAIPWLGQLMETLGQQRIFGPDTRAEILLIDDGSTDGTSAQVEKLATKHPNIRMETKSNGGQASARRLALELARGEYLYFMDQDDLLAPDILLPQTLALKQAGGDILRFKFETPSISRVPEIKSHTSAVPWKVTGRTSGREYIIRTQGLCRQHALWSAIWRKDFLRDNNLTFVSDVHYNDDRLLTWQAMMLDPDIILTDCVGYYWIQHPSSNSHDTSTANKSRQIDGIRRLIEYEGELIRQQPSSISRHMSTHFLRREQSWNVVTVWASLLKHRSLGYREALSMIEESIGNGSMPVTDKPLYTRRQLGAAAGPLYAIHLLCRYPWLLKQVAKLRLK